MTEDDEKMFDILDQFPQQLLIQKILKFFLTSQGWVNLKGMFVSFLIDK